MSKFDLDNMLSELGVDPSNQPPQDASVDAAAAPPSPSEHAPAPSEGADPFTSIYQPGDDERAGAPKDLERALVASGAVAQEQMTVALNVLRQSPGHRLVDVLVDQGADEHAMQRIVAEQAGLPYLQIDRDNTDSEVDRSLIEKLGAPFCKEHQVLPLRIEDGRLLVGATRPDDVFILDDVRRRLGVNALRMVVIARADITATLDFFGQADADDLDIDDILSGIEEDDVELQEQSHDDPSIDLEKQAGESPVIRYVNYILQTAVKEGASDIHIEPGEGRLKVRFRIDGVLFEMMQPPKSMAAAIVSRLKIMADLDISERRLPQDGRIRANVQRRKLDLRLSTLPTAYGEKCVLRILDNRSISVELDQLGFDENTLNIWKNQVDEPHGVVLVTGPTGSGKTTTLYASLRQMDKQRLNISTVEDPIEYHLDGITQTQMHEKIGMTFARALKALLRQDPDVVMVGEIRDLETAHIAVQAALTGHLVLSTLHTNDAPSTITRLVNIGVDPFLVGAGVNGVLAQRLVRKICEHCCEPAEFGEEMTEFLEMNGVDPSAMRKGQGCDRCRNTGYAGRLGIYEMLTCDDELRDVIARNPNVAEFRRLCIERGMVTLRQDGLSKAAAGRTTVQEILRVTESAA